jgi:hypothetical protein
MANSSLFSWCTCDGGHICFPCKILTVFVITLIAGVVWYFIKKRKGTDTKSDEKMR